ncbi:MAG TPA: O-antigen ligase family protein [Cyclobacteriaceae bacterium]
MITIVAVSFTYTDFLIDEALIGRFVVFTFGLILCVVFWTTSETNELKIKVPVIFYILYFLISLISAMWSISVSESLFESSRLFLGLTVLVFTLTLYGEYFLKRLAYIFLFITVGYLFILFNEISNAGIDTFSKANMYAITGINGHKNELSGFLFLLLPFLITSYSEFKSRVLKMAVVVGVVALLILIALLQARAVWAGIGVTSGSAILLLLLKNRSKFLVNFNLPRVLFTLGVIILVLFALITKSSFFSEDSELTSSATFKVRKLLWGKSFEMIKDNPVVGVGSGNWRINFSDYTLEGFSNSNSDGDAIQKGLMIPDRPHNDFLWILTETGLIGFILYLAFILTVILYSIKTFLKNDLSFRASAFLVFLLGYLAISFFSFPRERMEEVLLINLLTGCLMGSLHLATKSISLPIPSLYVKWISIVLLSCSLIVGIFRIKGEYYVRKVIEARQINDIERVISYSQKAKSFLYQVDNFGMPVSWYEGAALVMKGDYPQALNSFTKAFEICPYNVQVLNNLASSYEVLSNHEMAKRLYLEAIRISPGFEDPKLNLAAIFYNEGKFKEALESVNSVFGSSERKSEYIKLITQKLTDK